MCLIMEVLHKEIKNVKNVSGPTAGVHASAAERELQRECQGLQLCDTYQIKNQYPVEM